MYGTSPKDIRGKEPLHLIDGGNMQKRNFTEEELASFQQLLSVYSQDRFEAEDWDVLFRNSNKRVRVKFNPMTEPECYFVRLMTLENMAQYASSQCTRVVAASSFIMYYCTNNNISITSWRYSTVDRFVKHIEYLHLPAVVGNELIRTLNKLSELYVRYGFIEKDAQIICNHRWREKKEPKRAPEQIVVDQYDAIMFDRKKHIPTAYRAMYVLLRLIPKRFSECIGTDVDCLSYPDVGIFAITMPTMKETYMHTPVFHTYNRSISGEQTGFLFNILLELQEYARNKQDQLPSCIQGLLFVSPHGKKLLKLEEFNKFLEKLSYEYSIRNENNIITCITSHDLRHVSIGERLRVGVISPYETMIEANHTSINQTLGYGYAAKVDETRHLASISTKALTPFAIAEGNQECQNAGPKVLPAAKFERLEKSPFSRTIPGLGLCMNASCTPSFITCATCKFYVPDPRYLQAFEAAIMVTESKITDMTKHNCSQEALQLQRDLLNACIQIVDNINGQCYVKEKSS